ncbi:KAT8 regulatory NSL complex subunit 1 [Bagarius yarrelli]|uniref:KAT8 regulatory NSL complex subunit 1 n=1 Tax=Bagarius yarrelli TaxID=175774 RepID=A0A556VTZ2_BAGYA|nr:KAT8 regulatory NSL complex subunit 1 [Bagarius yarrelli]
MAPALTDTPADTHRIRLKLAPSSSAINPSAVEENGAPDRVLIPTNGTIKRKNSSDKEDHLSCATGTFNKDESGRDLGKIQQLVTSYRCSDETLKLQNVFDILPGFLQCKHHTLELSEEQLKSIMSAGNASGLPSLQQNVGASVNGLARKLSKASKDSNSVTMNGGKHGQTPLPLAYGRTTGNGPVKDSTEQHQCPRGISRDRPNNQEIPESPAPFRLPSQERNGSDCLATLSTEVSVTTTTTPALQPPGSLGGDLHTRSQQAKSRQLEIEGRLRRLCKRLQVVQAKQVERHVQQQLGGLLNRTLGPQDSWVHQERAEHSRFLRGGSVPAELERLSLTCSTNLRAAENSFDSDATESSSGGETDVEEDELARTDVEQRHISLCLMLTGQIASVSMESNLRKSYPSVRHVNGVINSLRCGSPAASEAEQQRLCVEAASCVAARTRPLISCRKRRLIRPYTLPQLNTKVQTSHWCGCDVSGQCVMCCSHPATLSHTQFHRPLLDRLAQLDPCVHPVLSFTDDVGMGLHLQREMKCHWQSRPLDKIKPMKKVSLKHSKFSPSGRLIDPSSSSTSFCSKDKLKLSSSLLSTVHVSKVYMEMASPSSTLTTPTFSPVVRQLSSSESPTTCSLTITPIEDLSDAAFSQLHLPCEEQERSRWSWTSSSVAKRRGSRSYKSVDGRSTPLLGGTNPSTPQPSSPDPSHFSLLQDYSSAPSPSSPASPELLTLSHTHTPASRDSHRFLSNEDTRCSTPDTSYDETVKIHCSAHTHTHTTTPQSCVWVFFFFLLCCNLILLPPSLARAAVGASFVPLGRGSSAGSRAARESSWRAHVSNRQTNLRLQERLQVRV